MRTNKTLSRTILRTYSDRRCLVILSLNLDSPKTVLVGIDYVTGLLITDIHHPTNLGTRKKQCSCVSPICPQLN